ncbi:hypothetical protein DITRI_Ditri01bG0128800 [Diplodiscus trichospermus]
MNAKWRILNKNYNKAVKTLLKWYYNEWWKAENPDEKSDESSVEEKFYLETMATPPILAPVATLSTGEPTEGMMPFLPDEV